MEIKIILHAAARKVTLVVENQNISDAVAETIKGVETAKTLKDPKIVKDVQTAENLKNWKAAKTLQDTEIVKTLRYEKTGKAFKDAVTAVTAKDREKAETPDGIYITGDSNKLKQAFYNILKNAVDYSKSEGQVQLTVLKQPKTGYR